MNETHKRRRPWVAAALSVLFPGLGHAYLREWLRMGMWLALMVAVVSFLLPPSIVPQEVTFDAVMAASRNLPTDLSLVILALRTLNVFDAYVIARQAQNRTAVETGQQCPHCGHELEDTDLAFCPWCGSELDGTPEDENTRSGL
ncbi:zinc ribbon domain-containing protein [Halorhabdus rudnickae]|uniref:zinc ribbon domain-containing protein n=1 Tax=Halorhabdus rudnickae TaxID=1775544 RepID=UPI001FCF0682|nr:zinc ribbon domain-containing protein [Halorhabdus rudnickae]